DLGQLPNNDIEQRQLSLLLKQQLTPRDSIYLEVSHYEGEGGDVFQRYDPAFTEHSFRTAEKQEPILTLGYHHEWNPGMHTLVLFNRLDDKFSFTNQIQPTLAVCRTSRGIEAVEGFRMAEDY